MIALDCDMGDYVPYNPINDIEKLQKQMKKLKKRVETLEKEVGINAKAKPYVPTWARD